MMLRLLIMFLLAAPVTAEEAFTPSGDWAGTGYQNGDTWAMEVQFVPGGARVDYPDFPCGGVWIIDPDLAAPTGVEWLTYGHQFCLDGLSLRLTRSGPELVVRWFDKSGAEIAQAPLSRAVSGKTGGGRK